MWIVGNQFHLRLHASCASNSSQSRAKNSTLKITNDKSANTIAIAFAASICPSLNFAKMYSGAVWVRPARLPETKIVEPNSPTARAKVSSAPDTMAPRKLGSVTCQNVCQRVAPMVAEASSSERLIVSKTGLITPNANGKVTKIFAKTIAYGVNMICWSSERSRPIVPYFPHSSSKANPATAVGIAVGSEMVTITALRPQKSYRDSTYAANRPKSTLKTVAQKLVTTESFNAKTASGATSDDQNTPRPLPVP